MKKIFLIIALGIQCMFGYGQKPILDTAALNNWVCIQNHDNVKFSDDGKYFIYYLTNTTFYRNTLIIQSVDGKWKREFPEGEGGVFASERNETIFKVGNVLHFLMSGTDKFRTVDSVMLFQIFKSKRGDEIVYQMNNMKQNLVIRDLGSGVEQKLAGVKDFLLAADNRSIVFKQTSGSDLDSSISLNRLDLNDYSIKKIWSANSISGHAPQIAQYITNNDGSEVAFILQNEMNGKKISSIWFYKTGMETAIVKVNDQSTGIEPGLLVDESPNNFSFTPNGRYIYFGLTEPPRPKPTQDAISVDVWNYQDTILQSAQLNPDQLVPKKYLAWIEINSAHVLSRIANFEEIKRWPKTADYMVAGYNDQYMMPSWPEPGDRFWLNKYDKNYLISLKDGSKIDLPTSGFCNFWFSPDGKYLVYYDNSEKTSDYFRYELSSGKCINISKEVPAKSLLMSEEYSPSPDSIGSLINKSIDPFGPAAWEKNGNLLVYDEFDIWRLDLTGKLRPVNITHGIGRKKQVKLKFFQDYDDQNSFILPADSSQILSAYNFKNKYNGFYQLSGKNHEQLDSIYMGPYTIYKKKSALPYVGDSEFGMQPIKSKNKSLWLIFKETVSEAPNYYLTSDFRQFKPLTNYQPQNKYNWLSAELMEWTQPDGISTQGILYKPENFDPFKKYPLIIHYYKQFSNQIYECPVPAYTNDAHINIPWYVSQGYLVFTPDIHYKFGEMKKSSCIAVESAARMLSKFPWIDSTKIGIAGHSWGGAETNYIVTHTNIFAAAFSGAAGHDGVDMISNALTVDRNGKNYLGRYEQEDIGFSLWQRPDLWIKNSPIFQADKVTTPFLMFYCKSDNDWLRAIEFFIALRRLDKKVWMLQYDNGGHNVGGKEAVDLSARVNQFFDYYLKGKLPPIWMTRGIPAVKKGIETGLELDKSGRLP